MTIELGQLQNRWRQRYGELHGELLKRFDLLQPFGDDDVKAVEKSPGASWAYAYKVIESHRQKVVADRSEKIRCRDGEVVTRTEHDFRRVCYQCPSDALDAIFAERNIKRADRGKLTHYDMEQLIPVIQSAIDRKTAADLALEKVARQRGVDFQRRLDDLARAQAAEFRVGGRRGECDGK